MFYDVNIACYQETERESHREHEYQYTTWREICGWKRECESIFVSETKKVRVEIGISSYSSGE